MKEEEACSGTIKQSCSEETLNIFIHVVSKRINLMEIFGYYTTGTRELTRSLLSTRPG